MTNRPIQTKRVCVRPRVLHRVQIVFTCVHVFLYVCVHARFVCANVLSVHAGAFRCVRICFKDCGLESFPTGSCSIWQRTLLSIRERNSSPVVLNHASGCIPAGWYPGSASICQGSPGTVCFFHVVFNAWTSECVLFVCRFCESAPVLEWYCPKRISLCGSGDPRKGMHTNKHAHTCACAHM